MLKPVLKDDEFLADVAKARTDTENFHIWWLGQSGFLLQWQNRHLLMDPYLSDSLTKKYANTDKPHVRMCERVIAPDRLSFIDVVTSSHNHTDHLDPETLVPLMKANPKMQLLAPEANRGFVADRLNVEAEFARGLDAGISKEIAGFTFHGIPAAHNEPEKDEWGHHKYLGYVIEFGPWTIYHSGDTLHYPGMEDLLRKFRIHLALLPINGNAPERKVAGNLSGPEAARLARQIEARMVIPCHFDMFEFNTANPHEFAETCRQIDQPFQVLRGGEHWSSAAFGRSSRNDAGGNSSPQPMNPPLRPSQEGTFV